MAAPRALSAVPTIRHAVSLGEMSGPAVWRSDPFDLTEPASPALRGRRGPPARRLAHLGILVPIRFGAWRSALWAKSACAAAGAGRPDRFDRPRSHVHWTVVTNQRIEERLMNTARHVG